MTQKYWITTQWPPYEGRTYDFDVELQYDHKDAGQELAPGDLILIYELKTGRIEKGSISIRREGRCGIIALVKATDKFKKTPGGSCKIFYDSQQETKMYWKWYAATKTISKNGFVSREAVNKILDYKPNYNFRGFGKMRSGLKEINEDQFCKLLKLFSLDQYKKCCKND